MTKFLAIVKREYTKRVRTKSFIVVTLLGPLLMLVFIFVPVLFALLGSNEPVRIAIVDRSGRIYEHVREAIMREPDKDGAKPGVGQFDQRQNTQERVRQAGSNFSGSFKVEQIASTGRSIEELKQELNKRVLNDELSGYLIIPSDILTTRKAEYYGRN